MMVSFTFLLLGTLTGVSSLVSATSSSSSTSETTSSIISASTSSASSDSNKLTFSSKPTSLCEDFKYQFETSTKPNATVLGYAYSSDLTGDYQFLELTTAKQTDISGSANFNTNATSFDYFDYFDKDVYMFLIGTMSFESQSRTTTIDSKSKQIITHGNKASLGDDSKVVMSIPSFPPSQNDVGNTIFKLSYDCMTTDPNYGIAITSS